MGGVSRIRARQRMGECCCNSISENGSRWDEIARDLDSIHAPTQHRSADARETFSDASPHRGIVIVRPPWARARRTPDQLWCVVVRRERRTCSRRQGQTMNSALSCCRLPRDSSARFLVAFSWRHPRAIDRYAAHVGFKVETSFALPASLLAHCQLLTTAYASLSWSVFREWGDAHCTYLCTQIVVYVRCTEVLCCYASVFSEQA